MVNSEVCLLEDNNYNSANKVPWYNYREQIKKVILPKGLTYIGGYAFYKAKALIKISIPASVSEISNAAFCGVGTKYPNGCTFTVAKGSKLTTIHGNAFNGYRGDIDLRECTNLTDIPRYTFQNYEHGTLMLPVNISTIYRDASFLRGTDKRQGRNKRLRCRYRA